MADLWGEFDNAQPAKAKPEAAGLWADFDEPVKPRAAIPNAPLGDVTELPAVVVRPEPEPPSLGRRALSAFASLGTLPATAAGFMQDTVVPGVMGAIERTDLGGAITRGATSALASGLHTASDFVDQTLQAPQRQVMELLQPTIRNRETGAVDDEATAELRAALGDPLRARALADESLSVTREIGADRQRAQAAIGAMPTLGEALVNPQEAIARKGASLLTTGVESAPAMALAVATRNPEIGSSILAGTTGAQQYTDLREQGVERGKAIPASLLAAMSEKAGEQFGLEKILAPGRVASALPAIGAESAQEFGVQLAQGNIEDQALGRETPVMEQIKQAVDAGLIGAGFGAGAHGLSVGIDALGPREAAPFPNAAPRQPAPPAPETLQSAVIDPAILAAGNAALGAAPVAPAAPVVAAPLGQAEDTSDIDALLAANIPPEVAAQAQEIAANATPEQRQQAEQTLGDLLSPGASPDQQQAAMQALGELLDPAPAAPSEPASSPAAPAQPADGAAATNFMQQAAESQRMRAQEQAARTAAPAAQSPAAPVGSRPAGGDLADAPSAQPAPAPAANSKPVRKPFYEMTPEEIEAQAESSVTAGRDIEDRILGSRADEYRRAVRQANSSNPQKSDAGYAMQAEIEQSLTEAEYNQIAGVGEGGDVFDDVADYRKAMEDADVSNAQEAGERLGFYLSKIGRTKGQDPSSWRRDEQVAYAAIRGLRDRIAERGWDSAAIQRAAVQRAASRFSDPEDAVFMLERFMPREQQAADDTPDPPLNIRYGKPRLPPARIAAEPAPVGPVDERVAGQPEQAGAPGEALEQREVAETQPTGSNLPEISRRMGEADAESLGLRAAINEALGKVGEKVIFLRGYQGLPERSRRGIQQRTEQRGGRGRTSALYDPQTKNVYVFTDVVRTPDRAVWNAAHEIAGHEGLRTLLGDKLDHALGIALQNPTVSAVADAIAAERNLRPNQRMLAAEEALAELAAAVRTGNYDEIASRYGVAVPEGIRERLTRAIENFLKRLKAMMDDIFGRHQFTDEDVRGLLENAWQAVNQPANGELAPDLDGLDSVADSRDRAEARRNEAAGTLPVARGAAGWNYDSGQWEGRKGQANNARAHLQDKMLAWRDVQGQIEANLQAAIPDAQNVYRLENLMHGRVSEGIDRIEREQVKPLVDAMRAAKVEPATLEEYLYARHAQERNAQIAEINPAMPDGGSGMTNAEAAKILEAADKATLEPLAKRVDAIAKGTRRRLLANGLITQEVFDAMDAQYAHYVPLRGKQVAESEDFGGGGMAGRGLDSRGKPVRNALGRGAGNRAQHILGEVIGDAERSVILAEKARVGRAVMRVVLANPNPSLWQVEPVNVERTLDASGEVYEKVVNDWSDPSVVAVRHKGQLYRVQINSVPLAQALNNIGIDQLGGVTRMAGAVNRYFSAILTKYNPAFTPVNATRDALFGLTGLAAEHGEAAALDAALHYPQAARAAFRQARGVESDSQWDRWAQEFAAAGGKTGYVNMPSAEELARKIGSGSLTSYSPTGLRRAASAVGDVVSILNDAVENALRLSAYVTLRKRGKSAEAAAAYAKDLTVNFNRKGFDGSKLNAWFLFYNASIQGAHRVSKLARKPKTWGYLGALATAQVIATLAAMGMEDDNGEPLWNKVPDHVKRRNIVIVTPDSGLITIPMPYGFNLMPYMAGRITESVANGERGETRASDRAAQLSADFIGAGLESFSPVPLDDGVAGLLPTVLRIPTNVWANRNDFGRPIRMEQPYAKSDVPRASMGRPDTLEVFKLASQGLNRLGGGDDLTPPPMSAFDLAPEDLEYLVKTFTGGPGNLIVDIATVGQKVTGGDYAQDAVPRDIPITKRFVSNIDEQASQAAMFYNRRETIDRSLKRVRLAFKMQGAKAAQELLDATPELNGAEFKRRKGKGRNGEAPGSIILSDGNPQIIARDENRSRGTGSHPVSNPKPLTVFAAYKYAEKAISDRNENVEMAYAGAPAGLLPNRSRDAFIRTENGIRQAAQAEFNAAWVRDVVGAAE